MTVKKTQTKRKRISSPRAISRTATKISRTTKRAALKTARSSARLARSAGRSAKQLSHKVIHREPLSWREGALLSIVAVSTISIVISFIGTTAFHPDRDAEEALERISHEYYIEYLYPRILGSFRNQPATVLESYTESGLPTVRLRQILSYNDGAQASSSKYFSNKYYKCDTNQTYVRYYPVEPFGPQDYTAKYNYSCEKLDP